MLVVDFLMFLLSNHIPAQQNHVLEMNESVSQAVTKKNSIFQSQQQYEDVTSWPV